MLSLLGNDDHIQQHSMDEERKHFLNILNAFKHYKLNKTQHFFNNLPQSQKDLVPNFENNIFDLETAFEKNYEFVNQIIEHSKCIFQNGYIHKEIKELKHPTKFDMDKVDSTIKQFYRDWSVEGAQERKLSYGIILEELLNLFNSEEKEKLNILIPGCGLGRLVFDIASAGFNAQGNEWSLFMLFASNFILNNCKHTNCFTIFPWIHQYTNNYETSQQLASITIPDINPSQISQTVEFSMAAGDFLEIYKEPESWDAVITCFFIDTAHNILDYIETIYKILKPGGYWINFGPLLYHYADMPNEISIELSYEQIKHAIDAIGFKFVKETRDIETGYAQNPNSMLQYMYKCVFFVAQK